MLLDCIRSQQFQITTYNNGFAGDVRAGFSGQKYNWTLEILWLTPVADWDSSQYAVVVRLVRVCAGVNVHVRRDVSYLAV